MAKKDYEKYWVGLKDQVMYQIIAIYPHVKEHYEDYYSGQLDILKGLGAKIDDLEGNHDIQNLLDDLARGE